MVYKITADDDKIRMQLIDLPDGLGATFRIFFVSAHAELRIAHLNEGEWLELAGVTRMGSTARRGDCQECD
jgi:hypothetical protein